MNTLLSRAYNHAILALRVGVMGALFISLPWMVIVKEPLL